MAQRAPCPECEVELPRVRRGPRPCPSCKGAWLDEEAALALGPTLPPVTRPAPGAPRRLCPTCEVPLEARRSAEVELSGCPACHGLFVGAGALEALARQRAEREAWARAELARAEAEVALERAAPVRPPDPRAVQELRVAEAEEARRRGRG